MTPLPPPVPLAGDWGEGAIFDHGAHAVSWAPAGHPDLLWMSTAAVYDTATPLRGGVPIVFPWFGAGRSGDWRPSHGFGRLTSWRLRGIAETPTGATVTYALDSSGVSDGHFPQPFEATYTAHFGAHLDLSLTVANIGPSSLSYEEALHTYIRVGDITGVSLSGLAECSYTDKVSGGTTRRQEGDVTFLGETDRVYSSDADVTIHDAAAGRTLLVSKSGSMNTVVWNPGAALAATMPDVGDDEWRTMVCVEGANVREHAVHLEPGQEHTMGYSLRVVGPGQ